MWTDSKLVLASGNKGKLREFSKLFADFGTEVIPQTELGVDSPEETGLSFIENALLKARHASAVTQLPSLADDSGLVVPAIDGAPGLYSARFAGSNASDQDNLNLLLDRMTHLSGEDRRGHGSLRATRESVWAHGFDGNKERTRGTAHETDRRRGTEVS